MINSARTSWPPTINVSPTDDLKGEALLTRVATERDRKAFTVIVNAYRTIAYNFACRITNDPDLAEDAVQDTFLQVWSNAGTFRVENGSAKAWIFWILTHRALDQKRKVRKYVPLAQEHLRRNLYFHTEELEQAEEASLLKAARSKLSALDEQLLFLYYDLGLTQNEIAKHVACSQRTVSTRLMSAVQVLRTKLKTSTLAL